MKDVLNGLVNENMVVESNIYFEDTRFSILSDRGLMNIELPKNHVYNVSGTAPLHIHPFYELVYTFSPMNIIFEDETIYYEKGLLIIIPPGLPHVQQQIKPTTPDTGYHGSVHMNFSIKKFASVPGFSLYQTLTNMLSCPTSYRVSERAGEIIRLFDSSHPKSVTNDRFLSSQLFHELINIILKSAETNIKVDEIVKVTDSNASRAYMISMMITYRYSTDITIEQVAQKLKMSTRQVSRIINSMYGKSFRELVSELRMKKAGTLLTTTDKNVSEISAEVGYNAVKGFYNAFKNYYGCMPSEYRKNMAEGQQ